MRLARRTVLQVAARAAALIAVPVLARADDYPARPVRIVVGLPAGNAPDIISRLLGDWLSNRLGQQFITDDRPGAANNIATEIAAHAAPDGYTLLLAISTNAVNETLYRNLNFDFVHDLVPVAGVGRTTFIMTVSPNFPAKTFPEFIEYAKANPGKVYLGSQGIGTTPHVCGELLNLMTGIKLVHVPYRTNLMPDLLAGRVHVYFAAIAQGIEFVKDGRLRALAVTTATRNEALPDVPAIAEFVPGYEAVGWYGICVPAGTPQPIIDKLGAEILAGVADPQTKARLVALGVEPKPQSAAEFKAFIDNEVQKWAKVIKFADLKAD
jgi:tripartite-type tricarboxylate transporter receptor subunit TctC